MAVIYLHQQSHQDWWSIINVRSIKDSERVALNMLLRQYGEITGGVVTKLQIDKKTIMRLTILLQEMVSRGHVLVYQKGTM